MEPWFGRCGCRSLRWSWAIALALGACGDGNNGYYGGNANADDAGLERDASGENADAEIPTFNGCRASDYVDESGEDDSRVITIVATSLSYSPRCLLIAKGQTVTFVGTLSEHPLAPGNPSHPAAGSAHTPIVATATGKSVEFTFEEAGTFPYYCRIHGSGNGQGMAGSIHVRDGS